MKKLIYLLALCVCLNGMAGLAEEVPQDAPEPTAAVEVQASVAPEAAPEAEEETSEEPHPSETEPEATPEAESEAEAEATPEPEVTLAPEALREDDEAWVLVDGVRQGGKLSDLLADAEEGAEVYIHIKKPVLAKDVSLKRLSTLKLLADKDVFKDGKYVVNAYESDPEAADVAPVDLKVYAELPEDEKKDLYFWAVRNEAADATVEPTAAPESEGFRVVAEDFQPATWQGETPTFTLYGIPEGKNWSYAAIIYDERILLLSGDRFSAEEEGVYTLRFAMLDEIGDIVEASEKYTLWLDRTPPEVSAEVDYEKSYTLNITASDGMSGVAAVSLDGGESWTLLADGETFTYTAPKAQTLAAGMLMVKDAAGNVYESTESYRLEKAHRGGGGGGGGGDGEGGAPAKTHASGDGEARAEYDALELKLPEDSMAQLTLGDEAMPLTLWLEAAEAADIQGETPAKFTASLASWTPAPAEDGEEAPATLPAARDTLVLTADADVNLGDRFTYAWRFNGEVYRLLANSGIRYLALQVGDDLVAFPTEGFTGGTKYTELKMLGVSTKKFDYTITMNVNLDPGYVSAMSPNDFSKDCDLSIRAEVENMAYELSSSPQSVMYFYDVYLGPEDMLDQPFGQYSPQLHQ